MLWRLGRTNSSARNHSIRSTRDLWTSTLLLGRFEPECLVGTLICVLVNTLCFLCVIDFIYRAHVFYPATDLSFSRVGYVDETSARIAVRAQTESWIAIWYTEHIEHPHRLDNATWQFGVVQHAINATDFVVSYVLENLEAGKQYSFRTNMSHFGSLRTAVPHPSRWTMVSSSCIMPFWPYNPWSHALSIHGLKHLAKVVDSRDVSFMVFLGDFIYIDLPKRLGHDNSYYRKAYQ